MNFPALLALIGTLVLPAMAQQAPPVPFDAKSFPLRDSHEGVTMAADPYLALERAKAVFSNHTPNRVGVLPVELIVTNDSSRPVRLDADRCQLIVSRKRRLETLPLSEIVERLYHPSSDIRVSTPGRRPPLPGTGKKKAPRKEVEAAEALFKTKEFHLRVIPPHSSARGFLFFDLGTPFELPAGAVLYVPDVLDVSTGQPLLYFEINLVPAVPQPTPTAR